MDSTVHAIAHGLFRLMEVAIEEYERAHQRIEEARHSKSTYPNFIWVSEEQRKAEAEIFKTIERVSDLVKKGETIPESLYRMSPTRIHEFLKKWDRLDLIPPNLENLQR